MKTIIYKATNIKNGKVYIGKTTKKLRTRIRQHLNESKNRNKYIFHKAIRKYGKESFIWEIMFETTEEMSSNIEIWSIRDHKSNDIKFGYNMTTGGEGVAGNKRQIAWNKGKTGMYTAWNKGKTGIYSAETIEKIKQARKIQKIVHTEETKKKISAAQKGKKRKPHTEDTKQKMRDSHAGSRFEVFKDEKSVGFWNSQRHCAKELDLSSAHISNCLNEKRKTHKGYKFKYVDATT